MDARNMQRREINILNRIVHLVGLICKMNNSLSAKPQQPQTHADNKEFQNVLSRNQKSSLKLPDRTVRASDALGILQVYKKVQFTEFDFATSVTSN